MKYNKSEIMRRAWEIYRAKDGRSYEDIIVEIPKINATYPGQTIQIERLVNTFSAALKSAWKEAKWLQKKLK